MSDETDSVQQSFDDLFSSPVGGTSRRRRSRQGDSHPPRRPSTRGRNAVTLAEREQPLTDDPQTNAEEAAAAAHRPEQLALFAPAPHGKLTPHLGGLPPLDAAATLPLARSWFRRELEQARRPKNTIESYCYDLQILENMIGPKPLRQITRGDIARFLGEAETRSTRKRRLTSVRQFFRYLINDARVLTRDPSDGFYPHIIGLQTPVPLFPDEQEALLAAAATDESWSLPAILLMMRYGLTRGELLALRRDHVDRTDPERPVIFVGFESNAKRGRERRMVADAEFLHALDVYLADREPADLLFPVAPPSVNAMVERVREAAGLTKTVTPQTLRHTFAVEKAKAGADETRLLDLLGLVDDPRNRASVERYIKLAEPPLE